MGLTSFLLTRVMSLPHTPSNNNKAEADRAYAVAARSALIKKILSTVIIKKIAVLMNTYVQRILEF